MKLTLDLEIEKAISRQEASEVIRSALEHERHLAKYKVYRYAMICDEFEEKFDLISTDFRTKFEAGELTDDEEYFDWYAAKRGLDHWKKRLELLEAVKL
jgi:hypothetical protein